MTDLNRFLKNVLIVLIIVFNVYFIPKLNNSIIDLFDNMFVRILCLGVILYTCLDDPIVALLLSVCFVMMHTKLQEHKNMIITDIEEKTVGNDYSIELDAEIDAELDEEDEVVDVPGNMAGAKLEEVTHYDPLNQTENVFEELEPLLNVTDNSFNPKSFDSSDNLKIIDQLDIDSKKIEEYNRIQL